MKRKPYLLEDLVDPVLTDGPKVIRKYKIVLQLEEAEALCSLMQERGILVHPYDFPRTRGVWDATDAQGKPYQVIACKELVFKVAKEEHADPTTVLGFKKIMPRLSAVTFQTKPINDWGTKLNTLLQRNNGSNIDLLLQMIEQDESFLQIYWEGIRPYDFPHASMNCWIDKEGKPTSEARELTVRFLDVLADRYQTGNPRTVDGFRNLLPYTNFHNFSTLPINQWDTTLRSMMWNAYRDSPSAAILDSLAADSSFKDVVNAGIFPFDFPMAPLQTWIKDNKPTEMAYAAVRLLIYSIAAKQEQDPTTEGGFAQSLPYLTEKAFLTEPVNVWGTTLGSKVLAAFGGVGRAIRETIGHYDDLSAARPIVSLDLFGKRLTARHWLAQAYASSNPPENKQ